MRQLLSTITSLFRKIASYAFYCIRAILNFVILTIYTIHDEITLNYISQAIYKIDKLKYIFKKYRSQKINEKRSTKNNNTKENSIFNFYFNFFK